MKKEYLLLAVVIIALGSYLYFHTENRSHYTLPEFEKLTQDDLSEIELSGSSGSVVLKRQDDSWVVGENGYPADSEKVQKLLDAVLGLRVTALVSEAEDPLRYDLGEDTRIRVTARKDGTVVRTFDVGKVAPTYKHTFVAFPDINGVYHAEGSFRSTVAEDLEGFRDKRVVSFTPDDLTRITIEKDGRTLTASRTVPETGGTDAAEPVWQVDSEGQSLDADALDGLVTTLSDMTCSGFTGQETTDAYQGLEPAVRITLGLDEPIDFSLYTKGEDDKVKATSSTTRYPFYLDSWQAENIRKKVDAILGITVEKVDPTGETDG